MTKYSVLFRNFLSNDQKDILLLTPRIEINTSTATVMIQTIKLRDNNTYNKLAQKIELLEKKKVIMLDF